jgi:general secretion pathway protein M
VSALRSWFEARSPRERRLLLVMMGLLAVTIVWLAVVIPVRDGLSSARTRYADAVVRLGRAEAGARAVKRIQRAQPAPVPLPIADAVRARASEAGIALTALEPLGPERVRIAAAGAKAGALTAWLARLEGEGLLAENVTMTAAGDGTVSADATLSARRS